VASDDEQAQLRVERSRRLRYGLPLAGVWLVALIDPARQLFSRSLPPALEALGLFVVVAFVAVYLAAVVEGWELRGRPRALQYAGALVLLGFVLLPLAGQSGLTTFIFAAVVFQIVLPWRVAVLGSTLLVAGAVVLSMTVPGWTEGRSYAFSIAAAAMAMFGVARMAERNRALVDAQHERASSAVLAERERFARDLHDILGHSLTVIAVKSELAGKLVDRDPERARSEIADIERLARQALADVRSTVSNYREVSLAGEIVSARSALLAAGIEPDLPGAVDDVPETLAPVFGYVVREGITNVVRHSNADRCTVRVGASSVEVVDDGRGSRHGMSATGGHGLDGLRRRVEEAGCVLVTETAVGGGFRLAAVVRSMP
jgi:two-component system sensor histidine kinase DesK